MQKFDTVDDGNLLIVGQRPSFCKQKTPSTVVLKKRGELYKCNSCDFADKRGHYVRRHMLTHSDVRPHVCVQCARSFKSVMEVRRHMKWHEEPTLTCTLCDRLFVTPSKYANGPDVPIPSLSDVKRHHRYKHAHVQSYDAAQELFACDQCTYVAVERQKLHAHMRKHRQRVVYECDVCRHTDERYIQIIAHVRRQHQANANVSAIFVDIEEVKATVGSKTANKKVHSV